MLFISCRRRRHVAEAGQRHGQSPLWRAGRCFLVRHAGGTRPSCARRQARVSSQPAASPLSTNRQQARHETLRLEKGVDEGTDPAKSRRALGYTSVQ